MTASVRRGVVADPGRDTAWQDRAACLDEDPELFFPPGSDWAGHEAQEAAAKAVCVGCDVAGECLEKALAEDDRVAIRGGMTYPERTGYKRARSRRQPIRHGTEAGYRTHLRRGEPACVPCTDAMSKATWHRRKGRKEAVAS